MPSSYYHRGLGGLVGITGLGRGIDTFCHLMLRQLNPAGNLETQTVSI